jgi:hypothetical protein
MFVHAIHNLGFNFDRIILVTLAEHRIAELAADHVAALKAEIVTLPEVSRGPADTVLAARALLEQTPDSELVVCNCDQVMVWPGDWALQWFVTRGANGGIPTIERSTLRHCYCVIDDAYPHKVNGTREKQRVSSRASIGVYWFRRCDGFLAAVDRMFAADDRAPNGEFYVGPVYNHLEGLTLEYPLTEFWSLGEPDNLKAYIERDYVAGARD